MAAKTPNTPRSGLTSVLDENFSVSQAIGGVRGAIESVVPGLAFVIVFVVTRNLALTVIVSGALALLSLIIRLISRQQLRSAFTGILSIAICLVWAWMSNDAKGFYVPGFLVNIAWITVLLISIAVRIPGIGFLIELVHTPLSHGFKEWLAEWRSDAKLLHTYYIVTWLWTALFAARLAVQVPLYFADSVGFLGTMRLIMGIPLFALIIWISWILVSPHIHRIDAERTAESASQEQASMSDGLQNQGDTYE